MSLQDTLPIPRDHDLPPRWDGMPVEWGGWHTPPEPTHAAEPDPCDRCGAFGPWLMNRGTIWTDPNIVRTIGRPGVRGSGGHGRWGRHIIATLYAFRCTQCGADEASILGSHDVWVLDESDYTDAGSYA